MKNPSTSYFLMIYVKRVMDTCGQRNAASWKCKITTPNGSTLHNYILTDSVILILMVENESRKITHDSLESKIEILNEIHWSNFYINRTIIWLVLKSDFCNVKSIIYFVLNPQEFNFLCMNHRSDKRPKTLIMTNVS
jgi:hypothetical protein